MTATVAYLPPPFAEPRVYYTHLSAEEQTALKEIKRAAEEVVTRRACQAQCENPDCKHCLDALNDAIVKLRDAILKGK